MQVKLAAKEQEASEKGRIPIANVKLAGWGDQGMDAARYRINSPTVVAQTIDGEAVVINLNTGCYYGFNPSASAVWDRLGQGLSAGEIVTAIAGSAGAPGAPATAGRLPPEEIEAAVARLIGRLLEDELIAERGGAPADPAKETRPLLAFEEPALTKYSDMQDLLLLDPIHEVTDSGWPVKKPK